MRLIDLTQVLDDTVPVYPGDPETIISVLADSQGLGFRLSEIRTGMHAGTHMDGPLHMIAGGKFISDMPVENFIGRGVLIDARKKERIDSDLLSCVELIKGDSVLVLTGFSGKFRDREYYSEYPEVTLRFAEALVESGVKILGLDTPGPDREPFVIHRKLLSSDVLIIENMTNLEALLGIKDFEVIALPARYKTEAAPVRVIARAADI